MYFSKWIVSVDCLNRSCESSGISLGAKKRRADDSDHSENQQGFYDTTTSESELKSLNPLPDSGDAILAQNLATCKPSVTYAPKITQNNTINIYASKITQNNIINIYASKTTQNDIINILGEQIRDKILSSVKKAKHFSLLADEATVATGSSWPLCCDFWMRKAKLMSSWNAGHSPVNS
ncbi:52 kda repressor of the inhibitor of the protein kinase [Plakobranchus ocellatus]|uniref:52 kDa repressor of the inhibitor of the protein kinase n=1 Tax=Plakobranchus ocellatus TaxID=259542 RepID=A0AAV4DG55_9GAST|nr:52 kda repressor of the inhibitor of the protein kinase [Plakobranchus ocellatus]